MSRMVPLADISSYVVTADDGTLFHCQPHRIGQEINGQGDESVEVRWIFIDTSHVRYVGPAYEGQISPQALQRTLSDWWRGQRSSRLTRASLDSSQF